jgi:hypothetical protein
VPACCLLGGSLNGGVAGAYEAKAYLDLQVPLGEATSQASGSSAGGSTGGSALSVELTDSSSEDSDSQQSGAAAGDSTPCPAPGGSCPTPSRWLQIQGVMIGRQAYNDPWGTLSDADHAVYGEASNPALSRRQVRVWVVVMAASQWLVWMYVCGPDQAGGCGQGRHSRHVPPRPDLT